MTREEYRSILGQLPIKSPSVHDMARVCPHLTAEEAVRAFTTGSGYVACPPLLVRHSFHMLHSEGERIQQMWGWEGNTQIITGIKNHPARLSLAFTERTAKSYADGLSHSNTSNRHTAMDKAMQFAEDNWSDELVLDTWYNTMTILVQDPTDLVSDKYFKDHPRTKAVLYLAFSHDWNDRAISHTKPESERLDDAISHMTLDQLEYREMRGDHGGSTQYSCAHCGHGLSLTSCNGCGFRFKGNNIRCGWNTPLSRKMVKFLRANGHQFRVDPQVAWADERKRWENEQRRSL